MIYIFFVKNVLIKLIFGAGNFKIFLKKSVQCTWWALSVTRDDILQGPAVFPVTLTFQITNVSIFDNWPFVRGPCPSFAVLVILANLAEVLVNELLISTYK